MFGATVRHVCISIAVLAVGLIGGCGPAEPKRNPVSGTVRYKGQPIKRGWINFMSEDRRQGGGADIADGKFQIAADNGLPAGTYLVAVSYPDPKVPLPKEEEMPGEAPVNRDLLPAKYNDQTTLKQEIKDGPNEVNLDLK